jgi:6,7-dimethyl-8-ribityllumazine synthase
MIECPDSTAVGSPTGMETSVGGEEVSNENAAESRVRPPYRIERNNVRVIRHPPAYEASPVFMVCGEDQQRDRSSIDIIIHCGFIVQGDMSPR